MCGIRAAQGRASCWAPVPPRVGPPGLQEPWQGSPHLLPALPGATRGAPGTPVAVCALGVSPGVSPAELLSHTSTLPSVAPELGSILIFQLQMPEHTFVLNSLDCYLQFCISGESFCYMCLSCQSYFYSLEQAVIGALLCLLLLSFVA